MSAQKTPEKRPGGSPDPGQSSFSATAPSPPKHNLLKSSGVVGGMTLLSRVLGLLRDIVIARYFGAGTGADAFFVAFKIPNFLRRLFAEGAFAQSFVPVLSEYQTQRDFNEVRSLVAHVAGCLGLILLVVTLIAVAGAPVLAAVFAPGFLDEPEKFGLVTEMLRITFPYLLLISLTAFAGSVLNSHQRFAVPAFTPVLLNLSMIGAAVWLAPLIASPVMALAWGVLIAGMLQLFFQLPFLLQLNLLPRPRLDYGHEGVKRIMKLMVPALFGVSVSQINLLLDTILASLLPTGSVSWLYYSDRLSELPLGIIGIAIATVILPSLSRKHAADSKREFAATLDWATRLVILIGFPAAMALVLLAKPLLTTLFLYGEMTIADVEAASGSLQAYGLGLTAFMLIKVLAPGYFSRQDTRTPVKIGIRAMVANMAFNLMLIVPLAHVGLALATTLSAWMNAAWLYLGLRREQVWQSQPGWGRFALQVFFATAAMSAVILWLSATEAQWYAWGVVDRALNMALVVGGGLVVYFLILLMLRVPLKTLLKHH